MGINGSFNHTPLFLICLHLSAQVSSTSTVTMEFKQNYMLRPNYYVHLGMKIEFQRELLQSVV